MSASRQTENVERVAAVAVFVDDVERVELDDLLSHLAAAASGHLVILALGVKDDDRPRVMEQVRHNDSAPLPQRVARR